MSASLVPAQRPRLLHRGPTIVGVKLRLVNLLAVGGGAAVAGVITAPVAAPLVALIAFSLLGASQYRHRAEIRRFTQVLEHAKGLMGRGDLEGTLALFQHARLRTRRPFIIALAGFYVAWTHLLMGALEQAIDVNVQNIARNEPTLRRIQMMRMIMLELALCYALLGRTDEVTVWLYKLDSAPADDGEPSKQEFERFVRAICALRRGDVELAITLTEDDGRADSAGEISRWFRIVRGFARGAKPDEVDLPPPEYPREYGFLGARWPEMAAFLAMYGY